MTRVGGDPTEQMQTLPNADDPSEGVAHRPGRGVVTAHFFSRLGDDRLFVGWKLSLCGLLLLGALLWG